VSNFYTLLKGMGEPWIKFLIQGKIVFKVKTVIFCRFLDLCELERVSGFTVNSRDMKSVNIIINSPVNEFENIHYPWPGKFMTTPVLSHPM